MTPAQEPVAWSTAVTTLVTAGLALATAFGLNLSENQSAAVLGFVAAMILVAGLFMRSQVTPTSEANTAIEEAYKMEAGSGKAIPRV